MTGQSDCDSNIYHSIEIECNQAVAGTGKKKSDCRTSASMPDFSIYKKTDRLFGFCMTYFFLHFWSKPCGDKSFFQKNV